MLSMPVQTEKTIHHVGAITTVIVDIVTRLVQLIAVVLDLIHVPMVQPVLVVEFEMVKITVSLG